MKILTVLIGLALLIGMSIFVYTKNAENQKQSKLKIHQYNLALRDVAELNRVKHQELQQLEQLENELGGSPAATTASNEHDFGVMDPFTEGEHRFVIHNDGDGPLHLEKLGKTCHCVGFEVIDAIVLPGESGETVVRWDTKYPTDEFRHGATVKTNDSQNSQIKFRVNGVVRTEVGTFPGSLEFPRLKPGESQPRAITLFSEMFDDLEIVEAKITAPVEESDAEHRGEDNSARSGEIDIQLASTEDLKKLEAKCGYLISVKLPPINEPGRIDGRFLQLRVKPVDHSEDSDSKRLEERVLEIPIRGRVISRLSVYDKAVATRSIVFGDLFAGVGGSKKLLMRVNDQNPELNITGITVDPEFVKVDVKPLARGKGAANSGTYVLTVEIPSDAIGVRKEATPGTVDIQFDHPRIPSMQLDLSFNIVTQKRPQRHLANTAK